MLKKGKMAARPLAFLLALVLALGMFPVTSVFAEIVPGETGPEPDSSTSEPDGSTSEPDGSTSEPDGSTSEPDGSTSEPDGSTSEPDGSTSEPDSSTSEPDSSTSEPDGSTSEPDGLIPEQTVPETSAQVNPPVNIPVEYTGVENLNLTLTNAIETDAVVAHGNGTFTVSIADTAKYPDGYAFMLSGVTEGFVADGWDPVAPGEFTITVGDLSALTITIMTDPNTQPQSTIKTIRFLGNIKTFEEGAIQSFVHGLVGNSTYDGLEFMLADQNGTNLLTSTIHPKNGVLAFEGEIDTAGVTEYRLYIINLAEFNAEKGKDYVPVGDWEEDNDKWYTVIPDSVITEDDDGNITISDFIVFMTTNDSTVFALGLTFWLDNNIFSGTMSVTLTAYNSWGFEVPEAKQTAQVTGTGSGLGYAGFSGLSGKYTYKVTMPAPVYKAGDVVYLGPSDNEAYDNIATGLLLDSYNEADGTYTFQYNPQAIFDYKAEQGDSSPWNYGATLNFFTLQKEVEIQKTFQLDSGLTLEDAEFGIWIGLVDSDTYTECQKNNKLSDISAHIIWAKVDMYGNATFDRLPIYKGAAIDEKGLLTAVPTPIKYRMLEYAPDNMQPSDGDWLTLVGYGIDVTVGQGNKPEQDYPRYYLWVKNSVVNLDRTTSIENGKFDFDWGVDDPNLGSSSASLQIWSSPYAVTAKTYHWDIDKQVKTGGAPDSDYASEIEIPLGGNKGQPFTVDYKVELTRSEDDEGELKTTAYINEIELTLSYEDRIATPGSYVKGYFQLQKSVNGGSKVDIGERIWYVEDLRNGGGGKTSSAGLPMRTLTKKIPQMKDDAYVPKQNTVYSVVFIGRYYYTAKTEGISAISTSRNDTDYGRFSSHAMDDDNKPGIDRQEVWRLASMEPLNDIPSDIGSEWADGGLYNITDTITLPSYKEQRLVGFRDNKVTAVSDIKYTEGTNSVILQNNNVKKTLNSTYDIMTVEIGLSKTQSLKPDADIFTLEYSVSYVDNTVSIPCYTGYKIPNIVTAKGSDTGGVYGEDNNKAEVDVTVDDYAYFTVGKILKIPGEKDAVEPGYTFTLYKNGTEVSYATTGTDGKAIFLDKDANPTEPIPDHHSEWDKAHMDLVYTGHFDGSETFKIVITDWPGSPSDMPYPPFMDQIARETGMDAAWKIDNESGLYYYEFQLQPRPAGDEFAGKYCGPVDLVVHNKPATSLLIKKSGYTVNNAGTLGNAIFFLYLGDAFVSGPIILIKDGTEDTYSKLVNGLALGTYTLYEVTDLNTKPSSTGYNWTLSAAPYPIEIRNAINGAINKAVYQTTISVTNSSPGEIEIDVNNGESSDLIIKKTVTGGLHPDLDTFYFTVTDSTNNKTMYFKPEAGLSNTYVYEPNSQAPGAVSVLPLKMSSLNGTITLKGLPPGVEYTVTEDTGKLKIGETEIYSIEVSSRIIELGTETTPQEVEFVNNLTGTGKLEVSKTVEGADVGDTFLFEVKQGDAPVPLTYTNDPDNTTGSNLIELPSGNMTTPDELAAGKFWLKHNETATISNIPLGVTYTVTEVSTGNYVTTVVTDGSSQPGNVSGPIVFTNREGQDTDDHTVAFTNERKPAKLYIKKEITGKTAGIGDNEIFVITVTGVFSDDTSGSKTYRFTKSGSNGTYPVGTEVEVTGVLYGETYTVTETIDGGVLDDYTVTVDGQSGLTASVTLNEDTLDDDDTKLVVVENTRGEIPIKVDKKVTTHGEGITAAQLWQNHTFTFLLYKQERGSDIWEPVDGTGDPKTVTFPMPLSAIWSVPKGPEYRVYEIADFELDYVPNGWTYELITLPNSSEEVGAYYKKVESGAESFEALNELTKLTVRKIVDSNDNTGGTFKFRILNGETPVGFEKVTDSINGDYYVYSKDQNASDLIGEFEIKHNETLTFYGLDTNSTYIVEETPDSRYTPVYTGEEVVFSSAQMTHATVITNTPEQFKIELTKAADEWNENSFQFKLYRSANGSTGWETRPSDDRTITENSGTVAWAGLDRSYTYRIYEQGTDGYIPDGWQTPTAGDDRGACYKEISFGSTPADPNLTWSEDGATALVSLLNKVTELKVTKVKSSGQVKTNFTFEIRKGGTPVNVKFTGTADTYAYVANAGDGSQTSISITEGNTVTVYGLPLDSYTVVETGADEYNVTYSSNGAFTITKDTVKDAGAAVTITNEIKKGKVTLTKTVKDAGGVSVWPPGGFEFRLFSSANGAAGPWTLIGNGNEPQIIENSTDSIVWDNLDADLTYRVYEVGKYGYVPYNGATAWLEGNLPDGSGAGYYHEFTIDTTAGNQDTIPVSITPENRPTLLVVEKEVTTKDTAGQFEFVIKDANGSRVPVEAVSGANNRYIYNPDGDPTTDEDTVMTIRHGENNKVYIYGLPIGIEYTVEELGDDYNVVYDNENLKFTYNPSKLTHDNAKITNSLKSVNVEVRKEVTKVPLGLLGGAEDDVWPVDGFLFRLYQSGDGENWTPVTVDAYGDPVDSEFRVTKDIPVASWPQMPYGPQYRVYEVNPIGYAPEVTPEGWQEGTLPGEGTPAFYHNINVEGNGAAVPLDIENDLTRLKVTKTAPANETRTFMFEIYEADGNGEYDETKPLRFEPVSNTSYQLKYYVYDPDNKGNNPQTEFSIKGGETVEFYGLPEGAYAVVETVTRNYDVTYRDTYGNENNIITLAVGSNQSVGILNGTYTFNVSIEKDADVWPAEGFNFQLYRKPEGSLNNPDVSWEPVGDIVNVKSGDGKKTAWENLTYGYVYRLYEKESTGYVATGKDWVVTDDPDRGAFYHQFFSGEIEANMTAPVTYEIAAENDLTGLTVTKEYTGTATEPFHFQVKSGESILTFRDGGNNSYFYALIGDNLITDIPVTPGTSVKVYGLPVGGSYDIVEVEEAQYDVSYNGGDSYTFKPTATEISGALTITNGDKTVEIKLTKASNVWPKGGFRFALYEVTTDTDGNITRTMIGSEQTIGQAGEIDWGKQKFGADYRIYELTGGFVPSTDGTKWLSDDLGYYYEVPYDKDSASSVSVEVEADNEATELIVDKNLLAAEMRNDAEFQFQVELLTEGTGSEDGDTPTATYEAAKFTKLDGEGNRYVYDPEGSDTQISFTIKHGERYYFYGLPVGATARVVETDSGGFLASYDGGEGDSRNVVTFPEEDPGKTVTIVNEPNGSTLTLRKAVTNNTVNRDITETFSVLVRDKQGNYYPFTMNGTNGAFTGTAVDETQKDSAIISITVGETLILTGLPGDREYSFEEVNIPTGFRQDSQNPVTVSDSNGEGYLVFKLVEDGGTWTYQGEATVNNVIDFPNSGKLSVRKVISGTPGDNDYFYLRVSGEFTNPDGTKNTTSKEYTFGPNSINGVHAYGTQVEIDGVIAGNAYTVDELDGPNGSPIGGGATHTVNERRYTVTYTTKEASAIRKDVPANANILEVTNTRQTRDLVLNKRIEGTVSSEAFTVYLMRGNQYAYFANKGNTLEYVGLQNSRTNASITIRHGESVVITGLPVGETFNLYEDVTGRSFTPSYEIDGYRGRSDLEVGNGVTNADGRHYATIYNVAVTRLDIVKKVQSGNGARTGNTFYFGIYLNGSRVPVRQTSTGIYEYNEGGSIVDIAIPTYSSGESGYVAQGEAVVNGLPIDNNYNYEVRELYNSGGSSVNTGETVNNGYRLAGLTNGRFYLRYDNNYTSHTVTAINSRRTTTTTTTNYDPDSDPNPTTTISDSGVPTWSIGDGDTPLSTLLDQPVPLAGGIAVGVILGAVGIGLIGSGVLMKRRQRRKNGKDSDSGSDGGTES